MSKSSVVRDLGALLWRRRWVALLVFAVVANAVAAGLVLTQRQYTASAEIAINPTATATSANVRYDDVLGTIADLAGSRAVLETVVASVPGRTVDQLVGEVTGRVLPGTLLVEVTVDDPDPQIAATVANKVAAELPSHDPSNGAYGFSTAETAVRPKTFSSPNVPLAALAGGLIALVVALLAALVADRVFRTVTDPDEMAEVSGTAVLGILPKPSDADGVQAAEVDADEFQSFRALRIAIEFASAEDPTRLLVCASAGATDGWPGWTEVNVAAALAEVGHRVLVVNAERDGRVHPALEAAGEPGLYDVLAGTRSLDEVIRKGPVAGVDVLPLGQAHLAAPSLLEMRFRGLVEDADEYDVIVVHAAPVSGSEDARIMAIHGALLLTVPSGKVHPRYVERAAEHLRMIRVRVLGSVLVGARSSRRSR
ncbi:tyrosine-protein kinase domain-containing protein [Nocardioides ultimimeridianus]